MSDKEKANWIHVGEDDERVASLIVDLENKIREATWRNPNDTPSICRVFIDESRGEARFGVEIIFAISDINESLQAEALAKRVGFHRVTTVDTLND